MAITGLLVLLVLNFYAKRNIVLIDTFLMSCRVLGRHLEAWMLNEILMLAQRRGSKNLLVDFIESGKNIIAGDFLANYGFKFINDENSLLKSLKEKANYKPEGKVYLMPVSDTVIPNLEIYDGVNDEPA